MTASFRCYPAMKDSGVSWLGQIPAHWKIAPGFSVYRQKNEKNTGMIEDTVLSLSYGRIVIKPPEKLHGLVPASFETYQIVDPGDIIIRPTDLQNDWTSLRVGIARDRGIITSAYLCLRTDGLCIPDYGYLLLHTYDLKKIFYGMGSGLRQNLDYGDLKRMPVLVPPVEEQRAIARFLDHYDRLTRRYIRAQRRLIALLEEQKQALIHRAVTRGLDPGVRLKASGVEWIEDISMHWELKRLKYVADFNPPKSESSHLCDPGAIASFLPMENVSVDGKVDYSEHRLVSDVWQGYTYFRRGDVVVAKITPCFENGKGACLDEMPTDIGFGTTEFVVLRSLGQVSPRYLYYFTQCERFRQLGAEAMTGAAGQQRVPVEFMRNFWMPIPPRNEQTAILDYLDTALPRIDASIAGTQRQIDLVREYRTRLIADVVTGKLDVRGVALPEIEPDEIDDLEDETPFDENHEEDAADAENGYE